jgi:hypothetical protein
MKKYSTNAERQRAYRKRVKQKTRVAVQQALTDLKQLPSINVPKTLFESLPLSNDNFEEILYKVDGLYPTPRETSWFCQSCCHRSSILLSYCRKCASPMSVENKNRQVVFLKENPTLTRWYEYKEQQATEYMKKHKIEVDKQ